jgi:hypothetical protein
MNENFGAETPKESTRKHRYIVINGGHESSAARGERPGRDVAYWNSHKNEQEKFGAGMMPKLTPDRHSMMQAGGDTTD